MSPRNRITQRVSVKFEGNSRDKLLRGGSKAIFQISGLTYIFIEII